MHPCFEQLSFAYCCFCIEHTNFHFTLLWSYYFSHSCDLPYHLAPLPLLIDFIDVSVWFHANFILILLPISIRQTFLRITISLLVKFHLFFIELCLSCHLAFDFCVYCSCCHTFQIRGSIPLHIFLTQVCFYGVFGLTYILEANIQPL